MKTYQPLLLGLIGATLCRQAVAGVTYPEITADFKFMLDQAENINLVKSEWTEIKAGEFVAIDIPQISCRGFVFEASFDDVYWLPGFKTPVLLFLGGNFAFAPSMDIGYSDFGDGTKTFYGTTMCFGQRVYLYGQKQPDDTWSMWATWGENSNVNDPGLDISRAHLGTLPDENPRLGFNISSIEYIEAKPLLRVFHDSEAEFILEASKDLKSWQKMDYTKQSLPGTQIWEGYVRSEVSLLKPLPPYKGFDPFLYFRLRQK